MEERFRNRAHAGQVLARSLEHLAGRSPLVLGLPRGGVAVAGPVALALRAPLDLLLVRKLGAPFQPELAIGAIGEGGIRFIDEGMVRRLGISQQRIDAIERRERQRIKEASERFGEDRPVGIVWEGRTVIITDDGIATGATVLAACRVARQRGVNHLVVAAPVATREAVRRIEQDADEVVVVSAPAWFMSISQFYTDFAQVTNEEVAQYLRDVNAVDRSNQLHEPFEDEDPGL